MSNCATDTLFSSRNPYQVVLKNTKMLSESTNLGIGPSLILNSDLTLT